MFDHLIPPLTPRRGGTLRVIIVARVSSPGAGKQDIRSLDDQEAMHRQWLERHTELPCDITVVAGSGSGELLDRAEYQQLIDLVASRDYDLVLTEDLGRIVRRIHSHIFCEHCEDFGTRLISINDHVDTAQANWRQATIFAAFHHETSNRDTSERIKRSQRSRFVHGGCLRPPIFGYVKPPGARTDADQRKDPAAEAIYKRWFEMIDQGRSLSEVARWLNEQGVAPPPGAKVKQWNCPLVARTMRNPLLKGVRERNRRKTRRHNATGKYVSIKADPDEVLRRPVPHLAFFDQAYYDGVLARLNARNVRFRRAADPHDDPCLYRPRKATRFPGQTLYCGVCGRLFVWGGHGKTYHLMCSGAREYRCWNGVTIDGPLAARKLTEAIFAAIENLEGFDPTLMQRVAQETHKHDQDHDQRRHQLTRRRDDLKRQIANIVALVKDGHGSTTLIDELKKLETQVSECDTALEALDGRVRAQVRLPDVEELKQLARDKIRGLAADSFDFSAQLRKLVPRIVVWPYRLCDDGRPVLRARFKLQLVGLLPDERSRQVLGPLLERELAVDLFDPPQRERFRRQIVAARAAGRTERDVAAELGLTITATQRAAGLQRIMDARGLMDPYVPITEPSDDLPRLRRHRQRGYCFDPLPGAGVL